MDPDPVQEATMQFFNIPYQPQNPALLGNTPVPPPYPVARYVTGDGTQGVEPFTLDLPTYLNQLPRLMQDTQRLTSTALLAKVWGDTLEMYKLAAKLKRIWDFLQDDDGDDDDDDGDEDEEDEDDDDGMEFVDRGNQWVEIRFTSQHDRDVIWGCRPYHVFGKLLVLKPWEANFDPRERIERLDLWVRLIFLPTECWRSETIAAILQSNGIGRLVRLEVDHAEKAAAAARTTKAKFARVCVSVDVTKELRGCFVLPKMVGGGEEVEMKPYMVWYEDFSGGCGSCGEEDHTFEGCPLIAMKFKVPEIVIDKAPPLVVKEATQSGAPPPPAAASYTGRKKSMCWKRQRTD